MRGVRRLTLWREVLFGALFGGHCVLSDYQGGARDVPQHVSPLYICWTAVGRLLRMEKSLRPRALPERQHCRVTESRALSFGGLEFELWLCHFLGL